MQINIPTPNKFVGQSGKNQNELNNDKISMFGTRIAVLHPNINEKFKHVLCEASKLYPLDKQDHIAPVLLLWECAVLCQRLLTTDRLCQRNHHAQNNG